MDWFLLLLYRSISIVTKYLVLEQEYVRADAAVNKYIPVSTGFCPHDQYKVCKWIEVVHGHLICK